MTDTNHTGLFITVEGIEGVGKSSNLDFIAAQLSDCAIPYVRTREPGGTPLAEEIRHLLLNKREETVTANTELLMIFAARAQHIEAVIRPALAAGQWVLCDRFTDATYAYQGGGRGLSMQTIAQLEQLVQGALRPDATLLLEAPLSVALERAGRRGALDRFELEQAAFFERVQAVYEQRAGAEPARFHRIDAGCELEQVQRRVRDVMRPLIKRFAGHGNQGVPQRG